MNMIYAYFGKIKVLLEDYRTDYEKQLREQ